MINRKIPLRILIFILFINLFAYGQKTAGFSHFITASGDKLMEGDKVYRFISFNTPNLLMIEDNMEFSSTHAWRLPNEFEIEDALKTIKVMGGNVTRTYTITVKRKDDQSGMPKHVIAPGEFNEEAFNTLDMILAKANEIGVRLIIPFVDNWKWMGGRPQYAAFRGKDKDEFWSDNQLRNDFKKTIKYILNRKNSITGIQYKNDKAILAWELGNELRDVPAAWYTEMAKYTKSIDKNHLINDGIQYHVLPDEVFDNPYIDILSTHHYERNPDDMIQNIINTAEKAKGKKPFYVGEFGFISSAGLEAVVDEIIRAENICGALLWSLRFHNRDGGFYWHSEPMGDGLYKAYHWPGFTSGNEYGEKNVMKMMQEKAFLIRKQNMPKTFLPESPVLLPIINVGCISWQGSVGAEEYVVERAKSKDGLWEIAGRRISDAAVAYAPLFNDETAEIGKNYFYRVKALNRAGVSGVSNIVGPIKADALFEVDNLHSFSKIYFQKGDLKLLEREARKCNEDFNRLAGIKNSEIIYHLPGSIKGWKIYGYSREKDDPFEVMISEDGKNYKKTELISENYYSGGFDYGYYYPILLKSADVIKKSYYLKIMFLTEAQIGRTEIKYGK